MPNCKLCDKPFVPNNTSHQTYCSVEHSRRARKIVDSYLSNRLGANTEPKGIIMKVLKNYNIPTYGVFDDGRRSRFSATVFDS